jgi:hypothetical protein
MKRDEYQFSVLIPDGESKYIMLVLNCLSLIKGIKVHVVGGADVAAELDAKRAINQASRLAAKI